MNKEYKLIFTAYQKRLKELSLKKEDLLDYFVCRLQLLRDEEVLLNTDKAMDKNAKLTTLTAAISEYNNYKSCISNYYKTENNVVERIVEGTDEEVAKKYNAERKFHWLNFWQLVAEGIEGWTING